MANEYATSAELKATLELTGETFADADLALALTAASRGLDNVLGRRFWLDADVNQVRYYSPRWPRLLPIDDLVTLTALATDDSGNGTFSTTWTLNTDFVLEDLNAAAAGWPYTQLAVHPRGNRVFPTWVRAARVTGRFGWPTVPDGIKEATMILAARLMRRSREAPFGVVAPGIDAAAAMHIARVDPDIKFLTQPFDRTVLVG